MKELLITAISAATLAVLAGCTAFSARPDPSRFFTLSSLSHVEQGGAAQPAGTPGMSLGIGPVSLPGYLDRQEIVTRVVRNQFQFSENDRWAEPLEENFVRVISQNVTALLQTDRLSAYPWAIGSKPLYQVQIEVLRFEADAAQQAHLAARWIVRNTNRNESIRYRETRLSRPVRNRSTEAAVASLSEALAEFSREIAAAIKNMDGQRK